MADVSGPLFIWGNPILILFLLWTNLNKDTICVTRVHETRFILRTTVNIVVMDTTVVVSSWHKITLAYLKTSFLLTKYFLKANAVMCWLQNRW